MVKGFHDFIVVSIELGAVDVCGNDLGPLWVSI